MARRGRKIVSDVEITVLRFRRKRNGGEKWMNVKKELVKIFNDVASLPLEVQDMVTEDIVSSAKERVRTIKRICNREVS